MRKIKIPVPRCMAVATNGKRCAAAPTWQFVDLDATTVAIFPYADPVPIIRVCDKHKVGYRWQKLPLR